jgi:hypothetical protein
MRSGLSLFEPPRDFEPALFGEALDGRPLLRE